MLIALRICFRDQKCYVLLRHLHRAAVRNHAPERGEILTGTQISLSINRRKDFRGFALHMSDGEVPTVHISNLGCV